MVSEKGVTFFVVSMAVRMFPQQLPALGSICRDSTHTCFLECGEETNSTISTADNQLMPDMPSYALNNTSETNSAELVSLDQLMQLCSRQVLLFALRMRGFLLPKSTLSSIMFHVQDLINCCNNYSRSAFEYNSNCSAVTSPGTCRMSNDSNAFGNLWECINTDSKFRKACIGMLNFIGPEEIELGINSVSGKKECYHYIPIKKTLQHYLQHEDVFAALHETVNRNDAVLSDYTDGKNFSKHPLFSTNHESIRLHFYTDDFEVCNPLSSARSKFKITAVYYYIGNLPKRFTSSLRSIHLALLARSVLLKKYTLQKVFAVLMSDILSLETTGVQVQVDNSSVTMNASVATFSADNLASHQLGGFRSCFSSGRVCRFCLVCYDELSQFVSEGDENFPTLRTPAIHSSQVASVAADPTLCSVYGVSGSSVLENLPSFCPVSSLPPDCMHDILEGVVPLSLNNLLRSLIDRKVLTVCIVNDRLSRFVLNATDRANAPPLLPKNFPRKGLLGTASQMWALLRILPFVVGELVADDDIVWEMLLLLRYICDIIFAPYIHESWLPMLQHLIADHHKILRDECNARLTPKCHFLVHYPRLIAEYGPLRYLWCMRFEAYHSYLKSLASGIGNFKNITKTLCERNQYKKCYEQAGSNCLDKPDEECCVNDESRISDLALCVRRCVADYYKCRGNDTVLAVKALQFRGVKYTVGDYFVMDIVEDEIPLFINIHNIVSRDGIWCVVGKLYTCESFLRHYHSYCI